MNENRLKLHNVAIAMHCNLRPSDAALVILHFNWDASCQGSSRSTCPFSPLLFIALLLWLQLQLVIRLQRCSPNVIIQLIEVISIQTPF